ncbi:hypothetical protein SD304_13900 [Staphylococcus nepalensis]|nr:hypothetical protein [Staphylococcus nepalensis]
MKDIKNNKENRICRRIWRSIYAVELHTKQLEQRRIERTQKTKQANSKVFTEIQESQKTSEEKNKK